MSYTIKGKYFPKQATLIKNIHKKYGSWEEIGRQMDIPSSKFGGKKNRSQPMRWNAYHLLWLNYYNENIYFPPASHLIMQLQQIYTLREIYEITGIIQETLCLLKNKRQQTTYYENYLRIYQLYEANKGSLLALPLSTSSPVISIKQLIKFSERKGFPPPSFLMEKIKKEKGCPYRQIAKLIEINSTTIWRIAKNGHQKLASKTYVKLLKAANIKYPFPNLSVDIILDFLWEKYGSARVIATHLKLPESSVSNWYRENPSQNEMAYFRYLHLYFTYQAWQPESSKKERT